MAIKISYIPLTESDLTLVKHIKDWYIINTTATYHTEPITFEQLKESVYINHPKYKAYLIYHDMVLAGYCHLSPYKKRSAYDRSAEVTIYLQKNHFNKGIGRAAVQYLEEQAREVGIKNLIAVISADNDRSISLFEKSGYVKSGHIKNIGEKFGLVLDVVIYQKEI